MSSSSSSSSALSNISNKKKRKAPTKKTKKNKTKTKKKSKKTKDKEKQNQLDIEESLLSAPRCELEDFIRNDGSATASNKLKTLLSSASASKKISFHYNIKNKLDKNLGSLSTLNHQSFDTINEFLGSDTRVKMLQTVSKNGFDSVSKQSYMWKKLNVNWTGYSFGINKVKQSDRKIIETLLNKDMFQDQQVKDLIVNTGNAVSVKDVTWLISQPLLQSCESLTLSGRKISRSVIAKLSKLKFVTSTLNSLTITSIDNKVKNTDIMLLLNLGQKNIEHFSCTGLGWGEKRIGVDDLLTSCRRLRDENSCLRSLKVDNCETSYNQGRSQETTFTTACFIKMLSNFSELDILQQTILIDKNVDIENDMQLVANALDNVSSSKSRIKTLVLKLFLTDLGDQSDGIASLTSYVGNVVRLCLSKLPRLERFSFTHSSRTSKYDSTTIFGDGNVPELKLSDVFAGADFINSNFLEFKSNFFVKGQDHKEFCNALLKRAPRLNLLNISFNDETLLKNEINMDEDDDEEEDKLVRATRLEWKRANTQVAAGAVCKLDIYQQCSRIKLEQTLIDLSLTDMNMANRIKSHFSSHGNSKKTVASTAMLHTEVDPKNAGLFNLLDHEKCRAILNYLPFKEKTAMVTCVSRIFRSPTLLTIKGFWHQVDIDWSEKNDRSNRNGTIRMLKSLRVSKVTALIISTGKQHSCGAKDVIPVLAQECFANIATLKLRGPKISGTVLKQLAKLPFMKQSMQVLSLTDLGTAAKKTDYLDALLSVGFDTLKCLFTNVSITDSTLAALRAVSEQRNGPSSSSSTSSSSSSSNSSSSSSSTYSTCALEVIKARHESQYSNWGWGTASLGMAGFASLCEGPLFNRLRILHCIINMQDWMGMGRQGIENKVKNLESLPSLEELDISLFGWRAQYVDTDESDDLYLDNWDVQSIAQRRTEFYNMFVGGLMNSKFALSLVKVCISQSPCYHDIGRKLIPPPNLGLQSFSKNVGFGAEWRMEQNGAESEKELNVPLNAMKEIHFYGFTITAPALKVLKSRIKADCTLEFQSVSHKSWADENIELLHPTDHTNTWVGRGSKDPWRIKYDDDVYLKSFDPLDRS